MGVTMWVYDSIYALYFLRCSFRFSDVDFLYCRGCVEDGCQYVAVGVYFCLSVSVQI